MTTFIFSATSGKKEESLLYKTDDGKTPFFIKESNKESLHKTYNKAIDFSLENDVDNLVLVHDDIILENFSEKKLNELLKKFPEIHIDEPMKWPFRN